MFDGALNVQLGGELMKIHYPKLPLIHVVEHTVYLFSNDFSKLKILNQNINGRKAI